ncbi:hypothetical protein B0H19DRAFT_1117980 [Mycena capillaripes]|nr:hypothetical protein B0H19DRAFT_1117980 [Mycena capillaripes]
MFSSLYYAQFPPLAQTLADLSAGNATVLFETSETPGFECACDLAEFRLESVRDAGRAVACNDGKKISPE